MKTRLAVTTVLLGALVFAGVFDPRAAAAQQVEATRPFSHLVADWNRVFKRAERRLRSGALAPQIVREERRLLAEVAEAARAAKARAVAERAKVGGLLEALGPPPKDDAPPEAKEVREKRRLYGEDIAFYRNRVQQAELARARAGQLETALATAAARKFVDRLFESTVNPFALGTIVAALDDGRRMAGRVLAAPGAWWRALPPAHRGVGGFARIVFVLGIAMALGWALRRFLLHRFGRDPAATSPAYAQRLICAIAEGVGRGIVPALLFVGVLGWALGEGSRGGGLFGEIVIGLCFGAILFVMAAALSRAVLSPDMPAWQFRPIDPDRAVRINRRIALLAAIAGFDLFARTLFDDLVPGSAFRTLYGVAFNTAEAVLLIMLARRAYWDAEPDAPAGGGTEAFAARGGRLGAGLRALVLVIAAASIVAAWSGYTTLGNYLNRNILASVVAAVLLILVRGLLREMVGRATRSPFLRERLAVSHASRSTFKFWLRVVLDALFLLVGVVLIAPLWGVPHEELWRWTGIILTGFTVGGVTISLTEIGLGVLVFLALLALTRMLQRTLAERVLPQTHLEPGIRHSLAAGFGYVGIVIAAVVGITVLGVDLSNLAIIAGALSVGIGFGLQNIVNNFVSGLILLIERPIKVGDWVEVGGNVGIVKRISVRSTEIETFQRAAVIVPNAEFLSASVTNWTHKDRSGRIEILIGVAYGTDTGLVRDTLLGLAAAHEEVLVTPGPIVLFNDFGASSLDFELRCYTANVMRRRAIASELRYVIEAAFRAAGIEIPFPQRVVHMAKPD